MRYAGMDRSRLGMVFIAMAVTLFAYLGAQRSPAEEGLGLSNNDSASDRSREVAEVAITRAGLPARLERNLGSAYGGVWFDPATARLHVGIAAPSARGVAEEIAARAGLSTVVTETPVRSSWQELAAAQERWNRRLNALFEREEVSTAVTPQRNSLRVRLGSEVSPDERSRLEREAAADSVGVALEVVPYPRIAIELEGRCKTYVWTKAYCNPPIAAGTSLKPAVGELCSVGPAVALKDQSKPATATETFVLTAGHCIDKGGKVGASWSTWNKAETPSEVGKAVQFINGEYDIGVIKIESTYWASTGFVPLTPSVALWNETTPEPFVVTGLGEPVVGTETCHVGHSIGRSCGKTTAVKQKIGAVTNLAEVAGATSEGGDSGGPWYAKGSPSVIEGVHVGHIEGGVMNPVFQEIVPGLAALEKYKLLIKSEEKRHPFRFVSEGTPTVVTGKPHGSGEEILTIDAGQVKCNNVAYSGEVVGTETIAVNVTPVYAGCVAFGGPATVHVNGCKYTLRPAAKEGTSFEGSVDVVCPVGKKIEITAPGCTVTIGTQGGLQKATFTNTGSGTTREITIDLALAGVDYEEHGLGFPTCVGKTVMTFNGTLGGTPLVTGETAAKAHRGIRVE